MKKIDFNEDWSFGKEGIADRKKISLPHDAMLLEERSAGQPSGGGSAYFAGGRYIYEKEFLAPEEWKGQSVCLFFEGVYRRAEVLLNGLAIGTNEYGYTSFLVPLHNLLYGEENRLTVLADNSQMPNSRWYSGSGIYRPVSLLIGGKAHIKWQGVRIRTLSYKPAVIQIEVEHSGGNVRTEILWKGETVASGEGDNLTLTIPDAKLWSDETPSLYQCRVTLLEEGTIAEEVVEEFGIRKLAYSEKGFFVNGKETLLRGGCLHHDNGILGAKSYGKSEWRKIKILKESGYNAIRSSHNPCAAEMLRACDYYGMYVIDEGWDMWYSHKNKYDYATQFSDYYQTDLEAMVKKDFNHPSVIMYSIGNEVSEPAFEKGRQLMGIMIDMLHRLDPDRPVTAGFNLMIVARAAKGKGIYQEEGGRGEENGQQMPNSSMMFNVITSVVGTGMNHAADSGKVDEVTSPAIDMLDIAGYNYASGRYRMEEKQHPHRVIYGSETFSKEIVKNWRMVKKYPYLIGDFMWTAWDYLGEAGSGAWAYSKDAIGFEKPYPWLLADMGALDILGYPNAALFLAQAVWEVSEVPLIAVRPVNHSGERPAKSAWRGSDGIPSWAWQGCQGRKAVVEVFHHGAIIELYQNGKRVGRKKVKNYRAVFRLPYMPGTLEAVSYDARGKELGKNKLVSASDKLEIQILSEQDTAVAGEVLYFDICIADQDGNVESNVDKLLAVDVEGGELLGFGSANPRTEESFVSGCYTTYYGRAQAVVKAGSGGILNLRVREKGNAFRTVMKKIKIEESKGESYEH